MSKEIKNKNREEFQDRYDAWLNNEVTKKFFKVLEEDKLKAKEQILQESLVPEIRTTINFERIRSLSKTVQIIEGIQNLKADDLYS